MNTPTITFAEMRKRSAQRANSLYQQPGTKISLELIITVGTVILLILFAIRPTLATMSQLLKDIQDRKQISEKLATKIQALSKINTEILPVKDELQILDIVVPNVPDIDGALKRIEKLASDHYVKLSSIRSDVVPKDILTPKNQSAMQSYPLTIQIKGSYDDIRAFTQELLFADRFFSVSKMSLSTKQEESASQMLTTTITVDVRFFGKAVVGGDDQKTRKSTEKEEVSL